MLPLAGPLFFASKALGLWTRSYVVLPSAGRAGIVKRFTIGAMATLSMSKLTGCVVAGGYRSNSGGGFLLLVFPIALALLLASLGRRRHGRRGLPSAPSRASDDLVNRQVLKRSCPSWPMTSFGSSRRWRSMSRAWRRRSSDAPLPGCPAAIDAAEAEVDLVRVQRVVDEANWSMSRARATLEGRPPPDPPVKLQRPGPHGEPAVTVDAAQQPSYLESSAPFRSGWFSVVVAASSAVCLSARCSAGSAGGGSSLRTTNPTLTASAAPTGDHERWITVGHHERCR